jgi:hypothetical protein
MIDVTSHRDGGLEAASGLILKRLGTKGISEAFMSVYLLWGSGNDRGAHTSFELGRYYSLLVEPHAAG